MKRLLKQTNYTDSFQLAKNALFFFCRNPDLNIFPLLLSLITAFLFLTGFAFLAAYPALGWVWILIGTAIAYFFLASISAYLNGILTQIVIQRLKGKNPGVVSGFKLLAKHWLQLGLWGLLNSTWGVLARWLDLPQQILERITKRRRRLPWHAAAYFALPLMMEKNLSPLQAMRRSSKIIGKGFRHTLSIKALVSIFFIFALMLISEFFGTDPVLLTKVMVLFIPFFLIVFSISAALEMIVVSAVYLNCVEKKNPEGFDKQILNRAFAREYES
ncbi:MAG: hypothetical protein H0W64_04050 [Gammaproteobacteria bacterium]|nr:hypothetical protein [Gammaproteobacteria bacterium]